VKVAQIESSPEKAGETYGDKAIEVFEDPCGAGEYGAQGIPEDRP
jgi:hypothetical protein